MTKVVQMDLVAEETFLEWKSLRATQEFFRLLEVWEESLKAQWEESLKAQWAKGNFESTTMEETAMVNAGALGEISILRKIRAVEYEDFAEGLDDE